MRQYQHGCLTLDRATAIINAGDLSAPTRIHAADVDPAFQLFIFAELRYYSDAFTQSFQPPFL
jgi:hypothetical protein